MNDCNKNKQLEEELCKRPSNELLPDYYDIVKARVDITEVWRQVMRNIFDNIAVISEWNITSHFLNRDHDEY